ncbi:transcriptional regulator [Mycoplana dimorpha]|uniref:transcriptional regulator n=1 Tax=Mycoplana dimorpha TaxID=28320 RepID=UPI002477F1AA|nr:transcriptional regulator [Mycoplana dimorpha]
MAAENIVVVAPDQGLRQSLAFALEVEGYSTEAYDALWKAEPASRKSLCTIVDDEILETEAQLAKVLHGSGCRVVLLVNGVTARAAAEDDAIVLTKPISGADLVHVIDGLAETARVLEVGGAVRQPSRPGPT